jgi:hypothetical protein
MAFFLLTQAPLTSSFSEVADIEALVESASSAYKPASKAQQHH